MNKLFLVSFVVLLSYLGFSQEKVAQVKSAQDVAAIKEKGEGIFYLPAGLNASEVQDKAKYYTMYFTVAYSPSDGETTISMVENTERARGVIRRFLVANDIRTVKVLGETLDLDAFFEGYLK